MNFFKEALNLRKEHGKLSEALLMRKFKLTCSEASKLIEDVEMHLIDSSINQINAEAKLKKLEMHITAEYE